MFSSRTSTYVGSDADSDDFELLSCCNDRNKMANTENVKMNRASELKQESSLYDNSNDDKLFTTNTEVFGANNTRSLFYEESTHTIRHQHHNERDINTITTIANSVTANSNTNFTALCAISNVNNGNNNSHCSSNSNSSSSSSSFIEIYACTPVRRTLSDNVSEEYSFTEEQLYNQITPESGEERRTEREENELSRNGVNVETPCLTRVHSICYLNNDNKSELNEHNSDNNIIQTETTNKELINNQNHDNHNNNNNNNNDEFTNSDWSNEPLLAYRNVSEMVAETHPSAPSDTTNVTTTTTTTTATATARGTTASSYASSQTELLATSSEEEEEEELLLEEEELEHVHEQLHNEYNTKQTKVEAHHKRTNALGQEKSSNNLTSTSEQSFTSTILTNSFLTMKGNDKKDKMSRER